MREPIQGSCESVGCDTDAITRIKWRGRWVQGCNRCASRVRQGGSFEGTRLASASRREKLLPRAKALRDQGKTYLEIASRLKVSWPTVRGWLQGA